jgi:hypothetical protein
MHDEDDHEPETAGNQHMKTLAQHGCSREDYGRDALAEASVACRRPSRRAAFSLLEVLMAVTVLSLIVVVIALIFQQANVAWGAGTYRAGVETTLRSVLGLVERDLVHAVDATQFPPQQNRFSDLNNAGTFSFVTLDGATNRAPMLVTYDIFATPDGVSLFRSYQMLSADASGQWTAGPAEPVTGDPDHPAGACVNGSQPLLYFKLTPVWLPADTSHTGLPLRVEIETQARREGSFAVVSGWSEGRNRPGHVNEDRIVESP